MRLNDEARRNTSRRSPRSEGAEDDSESYPSSFKKIKEEDDEEGEGEALPYYEGDEFGDIDFDAAFDDAYDEVGDEEEDEYERTD